MPQSVLSNFKELLFAIYGKETSQTTVYSMCQVAKQNEIFHTCINERWRHYPLQVCSYICGMSTILSMCLAASLDESFVSLTGSIDQVKGYEYLRHISSYNDFLRLVVFQWLLNKKSDISMIRCAEIVDETDNLQQGGTSTPTAIAGQTSIRGNAPDKSSNKTGNEQLPDQNADKYTPCHPSSHSVSNIPLGSRRTTCHTLIDLCYSSGGRKCNIGYQHHHCKVCPPLEAFSVLISYQSA